MKIIGYKELSAQHKFGFVRFDEVTKDSLKGDRRVQAEVGPRQDITIIPSGDSDVALSGGKCQHGIYIPRYSQTQEEDRAQYCSICNPYIIEVPGGNANGSGDVRPTESGQAVSTPS